MGISSQAGCIMEKKCSKCGETKPFSEFSYRQSKGLYSCRCKACISVQNKDYYRRNKEKVKAQTRRYAQSKKHDPERKRKMRQYHINRHRNLKRKALDVVGTSCACCGEAGFEFLTIDHVNNDGHIHRKEINMRNIYEWLANNDYQSPYELQTLCFNCNFAKRYNNGVCPHEHLEGSETIRKE